MAKRGPKGKPVVWMVSEEIEFFYDTVRDAARHLKALHPEIRSSVPTTSTMISLSCTIQNRRVARQKFRWATEEDIDKYRGGE